MKTVRWNKLLQPLTNVRSSSSCCDETVNTETLVVMRQRVKSKSGSHSVRIKAKLDTDTVENKCENN